jgi:putative ABC transport system permease protein
VFLNFIKNLLRYLLKNKGFAVTNILGLAIGICSVLFISLYVVNELSFESNYQDSDRIFRVALHRFYPTKEKRFATGSVMLAPTLQEKIPELESATRLHRLLFQNEVRVEVNDKIFNETHFLFADSNFFRVFNHPFVEGHSTKVLNDPSSVVLTESTARRYFGKTQVVGELIKMDTVTLKISAVVKDQPSTSHIQFDLLGSIESLSHIKSALEKNEWTLAWVYTYIKLKPGSNSRVVEEEIQKITDVAAVASITAKFGSTFKEEGHRFNYFLQPLQKIHLSSNLEGEVTPNSSVEFIYLLLIASIIILIITVINFINLSISKIGERAKEMGIRKALGASNLNVRIHVIAESMFVCVISFVISCLFIWIFWAQFVRLTGQSIALSSVAKPIHFLYLIIFFFIVSIAAGLYPAYLFGSLLPSRVLKGEYKSGKKSIRVRNILLVIQFSIAIAMIIGSVVGLQQMEYIKNKNLGFSQEHLIRIKRTQSLRANYNSFFNQVKNLPTVENVGGGTDTAVPGNFLGTGVFENVENPSVSDVSASATTFGTGFFETLHLKLIEGRIFSNQISDSSLVIINNTAVKAFELKEPIGAKIRFLFNKKIYTVVGVVDDYHFFSLHSSISPLVIFGTGQNEAMPSMIVKLNQPISASAINDIEKIWEKISQNPFEYSILSNDIAHLYQSDQVTIRIFQIFTLLAIILSCIGLIGLISNLAQQRLKEMSIRRVLGATHVEVIYVFAFPFMKMTFYAAVIAFIASYWVVSQWLNSFGYHQPLSIGPYLMTFVLAFIILFISLSTQFFKLIKINTVKLLKEN